MSFNNQSIGGSSMVFGNHSMYATKSMRIMQFMVQETGTYDQQWKRPYSSGMNKHTFDNIVNAIDSAKAITPAALTGLSNQFLHPQAQPESHIIIPNGWNERRLRFFLEVQTESQMGAVQTEYILGYSEYAGLSDGLQIDPNMKFIINGINITRSIYNGTILGTNRQSNLIDSSHLLVNDQYSGIHTPNKLFSLRPEEIYSQMDASSIASELDTNDFIDTQLQVTRAPMKTKRTNAIAPVFVSTVLDSYLQTQRSAGDEATRDSIFETAKATVRSDPCNTDPFVSFMRTRGDGSGNSFTYNDLIALDSDVVHKTIPLKLTPTTRATVAQTGMGANWAAANTETVFATCLSQSLPGYMLTYGINKIHMLTTNRDIGSKITTKVTNALSLMKGMDLTPFISSFLFKVENELLRDLTYNNSMDFAIDISVDLTGETKINLSVNGGPFVLYITPSFCDALMTPVTTAHVANLNGIANDFDSLISQIGSMSPAIGGLANGFGNI